MAPNVGEESQLTDPTRVGDFEAEDPEVLKREEKEGKERKGAKDSAPKKRKHVVVKNLMMNVRLPEQGSWHYERKKEILKKHPEIMKLYGKNPFTFVIMLCGVIAQTSLAIFISQFNWWIILATILTLGTYLSWVCMVTGHEGSHGLVFSSPAMNKLHSVLAFTPLFLGPFGAFWSIEHMYHHQVVVDKMNRYGPQKNKLFRKILTTLLFMNITSAGFSVVSVFAALKVIFTYVAFLLGLSKERLPEKFNFPPYNHFPQVAKSPWFFFSFAVLIPYNIFLYSMAGFTPIIFLFLSNNFCNGLHPLGMRQVQEHYIVRKNQPTNSVYSSLSTILLNIGYHNEHHDFPTIPWNNLPKVREIAPEFYNNLFYYDSYSQVFKDFFTKEGIPFTSLLDDIADPSTVKAPKLD